MYGWMGKILHVNLNSSEIKTIATQPYAEQYLGGRGIASRIYWEAVTPEIKAFDPENLLIFMTGPMVATGAQAAKRLSVIGKSPMTFPEGYCYGNLGGFFPAELKKGGFEGVVIEGRAPKPIYQYGERICNLKRAILVREGRRVLEADFPPELQLHRTIANYPKFSGNDGSWS